MKVKLNLPHWNPPPIPIIRVEKRNGDQACTKRIQELCKKLTKYSDYLAKEYNIHVSRGE